VAIVCHCQVVTDRDVVAAVQSGACTLSAVCRSTGAGADCGSCVFSLRRLMCEHVEMISRSLGQVEGAAS